MNIWFEALLKLRCWNSYSTRYKLSSLDPSLGYPPLHRSGGHTQLIGKFPFGEISHDQLILVAKVNVIVIRLFICDSI